MNPKTDFKQTETREPGKLGWQLKQLGFAVNRYRINLLLFIAAALLASGLGTQIHPALYRFSPWSLLPALLLFSAALSVRIAHEWERAVILRFGRYTRTAGPGIFWLIPVVHTVADYLDSRIRVTDFSAERVLTEDAVPVYVDAVIFWMVWDAAKANLEVARYPYAVTMSAKTALRDIIGKNPLTRLLRDRDGIGQQLQKILDDKTNPWGITSLSVEIKDIVIPEELEDAMSREAQAERDKQARLIIGQAEAEVAELYRNAADTYSGDDTALQLRSLNLLLDSLKQGGSMILLPSDAPELTNRATAAALARANRPAAQPPLPPDTTAG